MARHLTLISSNPERMAEMAEAVAEAERHDEDDDTILCLFDDERRLIDLFHRSALLNAKRAAEAEATSRGIDADDLWWSDDGVEWSLIRTSYRATLFTIEQRDLIR